MNLSTLIAPAWVLFQGLHAPIPSKLEVQLPTSDNRRFDTRIKSQGAEGTCTAFAVTAAEEHEALRMGLGYRNLSERHRWNQYKKYNTWAAFDAATRYWVTWESIWPYGNANPRSFIIPISKISSFSEAETWAEVAEHLATGKAAVLSTEVTDAWETVGKDGVIDPVNTQTIGGHAIALSGLIEKNSRLSFIIKNSWGTAWGANGFAYLDIKYCMYKECYVHLVDGVDSP